MRDWHRGAVGDFALKAKYEFKNVLLYVPNVLYLFYALLPVLDLNTSTWVLRTIAALLAGLCWYILSRILKTVWNDFFQCLKWARGMWLSAWFAVGEFCPLPYGPDSDFFFVCLWSWTLSRRDVMTCSETELWFQWNWWPWSCSAVYILKHFRGGGYSLVMKRRTPPTGAWICYDDVIHGDLMLYLQMMHNYCIIFKHKVRSYRRWSALMY